MAAKHTFLLALEGLRVRGAIGRGIHINNHLLLTTDGSAVSKWFPETVREQIGSLEYEHLRKADALLYGESHTDAYDDETCQQELLKFLTRVKTLQMCLWLIKDNGVSFEKGFAYTKTPERRSKVSSRSYNGLCAAADKRNSVAFFSDSEIRSARDLMREIWEHEPAAETVGEAAEPIFGGVPLFSRAFYFIQSARFGGQSTRVADYCSALECLLLPLSAGELTTRLALRVAWLLGDSVSTRLRVYQLIKDAYDIRSLAVHGGAEKRTKAERKLANTPAFDNLVRCVVSALLSWPQATPYLMSPNPNLTTYDALLHGLCLGNRDGLPESDVSSLVDERGRDSEQRPAVLPRKDVQ